MVYACAWAISSGLTLPPAAKSPSVGVNVSFRMRVMGTVMGRVMVIGTVEGRVWSL